MRVVTHDGTFHSDEVFAVALLKRFVSKGNMEIIRTRDKYLLNEYTSDKNVFVIDVGRKYEEQNKNFDHHQRDFKDCWEDEIFYSSCGLIWKYIKKKQYLKKYSYEMLKNIENSLIKRIDMHDNGIKGWPLSGMIASCNREENTLDTFNRAVDVASVYLENVFHQEITNDKNHVILENDLKKYNGKEVFISSVPIKNGYFLRKLSYNTHALVLIYSSNEDNQERWYSKSINRYYEEEDERIQVSALAPEKWRGLSDKELVSATGVKGAIFVHRAGFLCVSKNKKSALLLAEQMIENYHKNYHYY
jgi:uncharacterized UPF0160 family protein